MKSYHKWILKKNVCTCTCTVSWIKFLEHWMHVNLLINSITLKTTTTTTTKTLIYAHLWHGVQMFPEINCTPIQYKNFEQKSAAYTPVFTVILESGWLPINTSMFKKDNLSIISTIQQLTEGLSVKYATCISRYSGLVVSTLDFG